MAQISSPPHLPPTPPPPVYRQDSDRSHSSRQRDNHENAPSTDQPVYRPVSSSVRPVTREAPGSRSKDTTDPQFPTGFLVHPPGSSDQSRGFAFDFGGLSPAVQEVGSRKSLNEPGVAAQMSNHYRIPSEHAAIQTLMIDGDQALSGAQHSSHPSLEIAGPPETHEPLQYHHQMLEDAKVKEIEKRASKLTVGTTKSDGSGNSDPSQRPQSARNSHLGAGLQRPDSGFSSTSDVRGRTLNPQLSPSGHLRTLSHSSRSPDGRPLSYVDLLNVPYPQPAPSGAENLVNSSLRSVVGDNASLLSTRKTLEMYRANVKKTNDPAIQYEFALFMISAAQEEGLEEEISEPGSSSKSRVSIKDGLLKEARQILQKLCDRSYPFAQYYLADGYASGLFTHGRPDLDRSFPLFLAASKHGHAEAMYRTALCYEWGWGCRVDAAKAVQFYQHAASKNHPGAMLRLGRACLTGEMGLTKRYREGIRWLKRGSESADFQYNQAPYDLACLHETGYGPDVFKDESYAAQLYTRAAGLGHKDAAFRLGEAYDRGELSCPKDPALSVHFYTAAAEQGHPAAQMGLCGWYMVGVENVLDKDDGEAYEWARRAAEGGLAKAQYTVGWFTETGTGCRRDPLEANVWYVRAADQGEERAKHRIAAIRAASSGEAPLKPSSKKGANPSNNGQAKASDGDKKKKFGIF